MRTKGSCLCGEVRFEIAGDFEHFFVCHCSWCRKDTGSAHAANLFTKISALTWLSGKELVRDFNLPSTHHTKSFCSHCGSALPNTTIGGDICMVPAGSLDDSVALKPEAHIYMDSRADWEDAMASIKSYPEFPQ